MQIVSYPATFLYNATAIGMDKLLNKIFDDEQEFRKVSK